ncbi:MAG: ABC transporter substrate-binding protein [Thermoleophilia bacterium]|nr:ABC transporter substrate-binding protein [Thermoleophilia bacterium]
MRLRAGAALDLSGRSAVQGRQAAAGLRAWARWAGADLVIEDAGGGDEAHARRAAGLAGRVDVLFGPYGSGPARAVARALAGTGAVVWNHGGAALPAADRAGARVVDVLGPAGRYWAGLAPVLAAAGRDLARVAVLHAPSPFGRETAGGAVRSLAAAGTSPILLAPFSAADAAARAREALAAGADVVVGCGRIEDDLALGRALAGSGVQAALVVCGVRLAGEALGDAVDGAVGPAQWWPGGPAPPVALPPGADYPAAQALAAGLLAVQARDRAAATTGGEVWAAARSLRTRTFLGPFAVDAMGRQTAHAPLIVRWARGPAGPRAEVVWRP